MKHEFMQKINKMGKIGHTVSKICSVILYIATVCCIVGGVLLALVPKDSVMVTTSHQAEIEMDMTHSIMPNLVGIDTEADGSFELDGIKYDRFDITETFGKQYAVAKSTPYTYSLKDMLWVISVGGMLCLTLINAFRKITTLFELFMECETPFTVEIADYFKKVTVAFIPVVVAGWLVEAVTEWVVTGVFDLVIGIDLTMVLVVVIVLMLSEIFRYGVMLQTESDETL